MLAEYARRGPFKCKVINEIEICVYNMGRIWVRWSFRAHVIGEQSQRNIYGTHAASFVQQNELTKQVNAKFIEKRVTRDIDKTVIFVHIIKLQLENKLKKAIGIVWNGAIEEAR